MMIYRVNAGAIPGDSWIQRDEGGGRILGEACHFVDSLTYLCGALPVDVQAAAARGHGDAVSAVLIRFADGSVGTIVYSSLGDSSLPKEYLEAFASGRAVTLDDFNTLTIHAGGKAKTVKAAQDKGQAALVAAFLDAARGKAARADPARRDRGRFARDPRHRGGAARDAAVTPQKLPITLIILSYNEEIHLERCLSRIAPWMARVVLIDSFSTDATVEIAERHGAEVIAHKFKNHADQFRWGLRSRQADDRLGDADRLRRIFRGQRAWPRSPRCCRRFPPT